MLYIAHYHSNWPMWKAKNWMAMGDSALWPCTDDEWRLGFIILTDWQLVWRRKQSVLQHSWTYHTHLSVQWWPAVKPLVIGMFSSIYCFHLPTSCSICPMITTRDWQISQYFLVSPCNHASYVIFYRANMAQSHYSGLGKRDHPSSMNDSESGYTSFTSPATDIR